MLSMTRIYFPETEQRRVANRVLKYGITVEQYDEMLAQQNGVCAICKLVSTRGKLFVDHDHACCPGQKAGGKCVRGLLCSSCNTAPFFKDSPARLMVSLGIPQETN